MGYSQFNEHIDIDRIVGRMAPGYACEVGAYDGVSGSNTLHLEERGWEVLCIEANPMVAPALTLNRKRAIVCACGKENAEDKEFHIYHLGSPGNMSAVSALNPDIDKAEAEGATLGNTLNVPVRTLDTLLKLVGFPRLDVLSVDVEGGESDVLDGFSIDRWRPQVIVIEDWDGGRFVERLSAHGYYRCSRRGVNDVFHRG